MTEPCCHKWFHRMLDEAIGKMIIYTKRPPSKITVLELLDWSYEEAFENTKEGEAK